MKRYHQTLDELVAGLSAVETSWRDSHSTHVIQLIAELPDKKAYDPEDVAALLDEDFAAGITAIRLVLGMSKDEFTLSLRAILEGTGASQYTKDRSAFLNALKEMGVPAALTHLANTPVNWRDILTERLKYGRGSAIKGQKRGRALENFTEEIVAKVFADVGYDPRCRFVGAKKLSTEKADFAIPSKDDPAILIECKAYGATGSKQTDILGDVERIVAEKRSDTHLLLVVDGASWTLRLNDLRKLVEWQNEGRIARLYTQSMANELEEDLRQLRAEHSLGN